MKTLLLLLATLALLVLPLALLSGCATIDRDFRSRVESAELHGEATRNRATGDVTGSAGLVLRFRDPQPDPKQ